MRLVLAALIAMLAIPAQADVSDQFASARAVFGSGDPSRITDGLDGEWIELLGYSILLDTDASADAVATYAQDFIAQNCHSEPRSNGQLRFETDNAHRFTVHFPSGNGGFARYDWIKPAPLNFPAPSFLRTTHGSADVENDYRPAPWDGAVQIVRPSEDIVVIAERDGAIAIWGRCPDSN